MDIINDLKSMREVYWTNPGYRKFDDIKSELPITLDEVMEAEKRLHRFAPYLAKVFPESKDGIIESPISHIPEMMSWIERDSGSAIPGELYLKRDDLLSIAGSIKARGGIYEVLKHAETLAVENGMLHYDHDYRKLAEKEFVDFFSKYRIQVGSTGNLGLSIGIMSAKLGFKVTVHMSSDAKQWKKDMLRSKGVTVVEYPDDYSKAVEEGRRDSDSDPMSHFVDDENSRDLFLGYAAGGMRVKSQLEEMGVIVDEKHPLVVYLPCGVGGGPGGVAYGLKLSYGDLVECHFAEPTHSPCMLLGLATGRHEGISVEDIGLDNKTEADGLAVGRPSSFVGKVMDKLLTGAFTIQDDKLFKYLRALYGQEGIFVEPSATAGFNGLFLTKDRYRDREPVQMVWSTGGSLVPAEERSKFLGE
ncbi:MAG: D-serine ammonia-lyase [Gudongella sp.]|nr:D-serine ammonia-lyase [Gudongella sp.]